MAQEPHRDIHLPPQGAAPHAQRPKTEPHAVPLDEAAFRSLPRQDDSAVFTALADGAAALAPYAEQGLPRQGGTRPSGMPRGAVPLEEAAFSTAGQAPQGRQGALDSSFTWREAAAPLPQQGASAHGAQRPARGAVPLDEAALRAAGQAGPAQQDRFEGFDALRDGAGDLPFSAPGAPAAGQARAAQGQSAQAGGNTRPGRSVRKGAQRPAQAGGAAPQHGGTGVQAGKRAKRKKGRMWKKLLAAAAVLAVCVGTAMGAYLAWATRNDFLWLDLAQLPHKDASIIYAQNTQGEWEEYARLEATQQKQWVDIEDVPQNLIYAFIAVEDQSFYEHHGVNWKRTVFAVLNEVKHMFTGTYFGGEDGIKQGASTITQQVVKNLTRDENNDGISGYFRKVREIWRALMLEREYAKDEIMEAYLNVAGFTGNTAGVQAESMKLFGKPVSELTLAECASLAGITKNPARYDPLTHPDNNLARRDYILYEMWQQGYISEEEYNEATAQPVATSPGSVEVKKTQTTSYFTDKLIEDVSDGLMEEYGLDRAATTNLLYNGGLRIYATVDPDLQAVMEQGMLTGGFFPRGGVQTEAYVYDEDGKRVLDENGQPVTQQVTERAQAAMVTLDYDGRLRAVVGGLDEKEGSRVFNRGTDAVRQVGSTMKPIGAYALALAQDKINWSTLFLDDYVRMEEDEKTGELKPWPANVTKVYTQKEITVADALAESVNTVAVRVGEEAGIRSIYSFVTQQLGITSFVPQDRDAGPMVLGSSTYGVTPYELAAAYMMFGSGGIYTTPHCFESVQTGYGKLLLEPQVESRRVLDEDTAYVMNRLLRGVMEGRGTASGYSAGGGMDCIGKTGTTSDNRDYWFVGLTPYYVTATWYGYDSGFALNTSAGTSAPIRAWSWVMRRAQSGLEAKAFPTAQGVVQANYCTETGLLASPGCPSVKTGYYKADAMPGMCARHAA